MKKNKNNFLRNGIKGFILAIIPVILIDMQTILLLGFFIDFLWKIIRGIIFYGFIGVIISLIYTYLSKFYPKISKYAIWSVMIGYYLFVIIYFIVGIYFHKIGPLFG